MLPRVDRGLFDLPACVQAYLRHKLMQAKAGDVTVRSLVAERSRLTKIKADLRVERDAKLNPVSLSPPPIRSKLLGSAWPAPCAHGCCCFPPRWRRVLSR